MACPLIAAGRQHGRETLEFRAVYEGEIFGITTGPDGNVWYTNYGGNEIGSVIVP